MLSSVKDRLDRREDEGFTLIELMVVVLIIAILLAIAIPTFLGARGQANSRAAQSSLRNALTAEQTYYSSNQQFNDTSTTVNSVTVPSITTVEPNIGWKQATAANMPSTMSEDPNTVYVTVGQVSSANDTVVLQGYAKDGNCYSVYQTNGTTSNAATGYAVTKGYCQAPTLTSGTAANPTSGSAGSHIPTAAGAPSAWYTTW